MRLFKSLLFVLFIIISVSWFTRQGWWKKFGADHISAVHTGQVVKKSVTAKLKRKVAEARSFAAANKYNDHICFLIDMSLPSGQNRFFIYDLKKDSLKNAGLVAHGNCFQNWLEGRRYSNEVGCGCTSLGKYKIGYPYTGRFGYSYKLYGLDSSNSNAFERTVVLHSYASVPDSPVTDDICQSNGCPMVSPAFLEVLKPVINHSDKPVLLWIFE